MFERFELQQLALLACNGGGFTVSANRFNLQDLSTLAANASSGKASLKISDTDHLSFQDLNFIAGRGEGAVEFI